MATDKLRFLTGNLSDLANKTIARGEVYFAIDGDNGKIVFDAPINSTTTKRIIMGNHVEFADKANSDSAGNEFISKYPFSFTTTTSTTTLKINVKAQNGDSVSGDPITIPAGTTSIAGLITTGTQSIKGAKTFTTSLTVSAANSFKYTGISASTADADTTVWFSHNTTQGTPVFSNNFKYNASSDTLTVGNVNGLAKQASQDSAGNDFISKYPFSFSTTSNGTSFKINIKAHNGDSVSGDPITVPNADADHAGIITNTAQNITGVKTFKTGVTIDNSSGFLYSGIESATVNSARPVWFAHNGANGKPVYNTNFTYNPSTQVLTVKRLAGTSDYTEAVNASPSPGDDLFTRVWFSYGLAANGDDEKKRAYDDTFKYNAGTHTLNVTQYRINDHGLIKYDAATESIVFSFV